MMTKGQMIKELKKAGIRKGDKNGAIVQLEHLKTTTITTMYYNLTHGIKEEA